MNTCAASSAQPLLEAERAEGDRRERVVAQDPAEAGGLAGRRRGRPQQREQRARFAVAGIERGRRFQVRHRVVDMAERRWTSAARRWHWTSLGLTSRMAFELDQRGGELLVGRRAPWPG